MDIKLSIAATLLFVAPAFAQAPPMDATLQALLAHPKVVMTLDDIKADDARALDEQKRITEIPAPPFKEKVRAGYYLKRLQELGFKDAAIDGEGNVIALRRGTGGGRPKLVVSAHLDTVFPEEVDVTVKEKDGVINAPGIGDDSRGLAALLSLVKAMNENGIGTVGDLLVVGLGNDILGLDADFVRRPARDDVSDDDSLDIAQIEMRSKSIVNRLHLDADHRAWFHHLPDVLAGNGAFKDGSIVS